MLNISTPFRSVSTLGDSKNGFTCSQIALEQLRLTTSPVCCKSFEEAAENVLLGKTSHMMVPAAYNGVAPFIQDDSLLLESVRVHPIPPLVIASRNRMRRYRTYYLYYHPATTSLLAKVYQNFGGNTFIPIPVSSNVVACEKHLANIDNSVVITNAVCADGFGMDIYAELNHGVDMPWLIFSKNTDINMVKQ